MTGIDDIEAQAHGQVPGRTSYFKPTHSSRLRPWKYIPPVGLEEIEVQVLDRRRVLYLNALKAKSPL